MEFFNNLVKTSHANLLVKINGKWKCHFTAIKIPRYNIPRFKDSPI